MTVVSDTTCLSALARINELHLLHALFGQISIPEKVQEELSALQEFGVDISIFSHSDWITIRQATPSPLLETLLANKRIDPGESYAIALAIEIEADWIILDDLHARKVATDLGLNITGLGGILLQAKAAGIIPSVKGHLDLCMLKANFRLSTVVYNHLLTLAKE